MDKSLSRDDPRHPYSLARGLVGQARVKVPERCDPADSTPHSAHVGDAGLLDVDERVRAVARELFIQGTAISEQPSEDELFALADQADPEGEVLSPYQVQLMQEEDRQAPDIQRFVEGLSDEDRQALTEALTPADPPLEAGPPEGTSEASS